MESPNNPFMDKRKYVRLSETLIVRCARLTLPPNPVPAEPHWLASTVDVSEGGVLIRTSERLRLGEGLEILFEGDKGSEPFKLMGNVVRYHAVMYDKIYYVPIAFAKMTDAAQEKLRAHINRHKH